MSKVWIKHRPKEEKKFKVRVREKDLDNLFDDFGTLKEEPQEEEKIEVKDNHKEVIRIKSLHHLDEHDREEATEEITHAIHDLQKKEKPKAGFFSSLLASKKPRKIHKTEENNKEVSKHPPPSKDHITFIKSQINDARTQLMNFDLKGAKKTYISIINTYNHLNTEDQGRVYDLIKDLYDERKNAENLMSK